jgi:hypothetical protein
MVNRHDIARVSIGIILGLLLGVVVEQSNRQYSSIYAGILSQGAFGAFESSVAASIDCKVVDDLNATDCCINSGPPYSAACCAYNPNWCASSSSSSSGCCSGDTDCDGTCDDDPAHVCCDGVCQLPDMCPSSSSSSAPTYCCAFDGSGCIQAPDNDPGNDACDQNHTGYTDDMCNNECQQQWCCEHALPRGPANCYQL